MNSTKNFSCSCARDDFNLGYRKPNCTLFILSENLSSFARESESDLPVIQKADLENHNKEGHLWVVIHGKVYDLQEFKDQVKYPVIQ